MKLPYLKHKGNLGLKLLALVLAIVLYHSLKNETAHTDQHASHDRIPFQSH